MIGAANSYGAFGRLGAAAAEPSWARLLQDYAPAISELAEEYTDPCKQAAVLEAKLRTQTASGASASAIRTTQAKLEAETRKCNLEQGKEESVQAWYNLSSIGIGALILVAAAVSFGVVTWSLKR